jgi:hypothetical protein
VSVVVTKVDVDGSTSFVNLGHTEGYKKTILFNSTVRASLDQSFSHFRAEGAYLAPWARCFERLSNVTILGCKISNISNSKSKEIALESIF